MGYSHYFELTQAPTHTRWARLTSDVRRVFHSLPNLAVLQALGVDVDQAIQLRGPLGHGKPLCNRKTIAFNGNKADDTDCETLLLTAKPRRDSCKTARKPYDFAVCAVLLLAEFHLPGFVVDSDGDTDEWSPALTWVNQAINPAVRMPYTIRPEFIGPVPACAWPVSNQHLLLTLRERSFTLPDAYF